MAITAAAEAAALVVGDDATLAWLVPLLVLACCCCASCTALCCWCRKTPSGRRAWRTYAVGTRPTDDTRMRRQWDWSDATAVGASKEAQAVKPPAKVQGARKQGAHSDVPYGHS